LAGSLFSIGRRALDAAKPHGYSAEWYDNTTRIVNRKDEKMSRIRALGMALVVVCALACSAQQTGGETNPAHWSADPSVVQKHVQVLGDKLDLTAEQRAKITPMLQQMHDTAAQAQEDRNLSDDERNSRVMAAQKKADQQIRTLLNDEQKKKLDALEAEMHHRAS
jgi:Spy/CpxP family protein refolding chaperone